MSAVVDRADLDGAEQISFRSRAREFLAGNAKTSDDAGPWAVGFISDPLRLKREFEDACAWQRMRYVAGMTGFSYPEEYGGQGRPAWQEQIYNEEASRYGSTSGFVGASILMLGPTLMAYGTEQQKHELLPRLLSAEDTWCQLFSEPGSGSDLASLGCRAVRDGDEFVVNGQKVWSSLAQWCDHGFLLARTNPDVPKHHGITMLLIDMQSPGVEVRPLVQATGAAHFNEVFLTDVRVPVADVLGEINAGWTVARTVLLNEAAMIGGGSTRTYPTLLRLADMHSRRQDLLTRQQLADYYSRERILDLMGQRILAAIRQRQKPPTDPSILKLYFSDVRRRAGDLAASITGPAATLAETAPQRWVNAEIVGRYSVSIGGGTTEVQKNNLAERSLGLPREPTSLRETAWKELPHS